MTDTIKRTLQGVAILAALALGAAAVGVAATGNSNNSSRAAQSSTAAQSPWRGSSPQHQGEELLTGDTASKVRAAALAKVSGGTIQRVETDADGNAAYEAHILKADGSLVTVYVNKQFDVVGVENAP